MLWSETEVKQVAIDMGSLPRRSQHVSAGNLASLYFNRIKFKAGETLVDLAHKAGDGSF